VTLALKIPPRSSLSRGRKPKWISAATLGAIVTGESNYNQSNPTAITPQTFNLTPGAGVCQSASDGSSACQLAIAIPSFTETQLTLTLYDMSSPSYPTSQPLSAGSIIVTPTEGAATVSVPVVLSGIVSSVAAIGASNISLGSGNATSTTFELEAFDSDGQVIALGDGVFDPTLYPNPTFNLIVPAAVTGVTLTDITQSISESTGTLGLGLYGVKAGDVVQITSSATSTTGVGVMLEAELSGGYLTSIGRVFIPSTHSTTPVNVYSGLTPAVIAGMPPQGQANGSLQSTTGGNGFLYVESNEILYKPINLANDTVASSLEGNCTLSPAASLSDIAMVGQDEAYNGNATVAFFAGTDSNGDSHVFAADLSYMTGSTCLPIDSGAVSDVIDATTTYGAGATVTAVATAGQDVAAAISNTVNSSPHGILPINDYSGATSTLLPITFPSATQISALAASTSGALSDQYNTAFAAAAASSSSNFVFMNAGQYVSDSGTYPAASPLNASPTSMAVAGSKAYVLAGTTLYACTLGTVVTCSSLLTITSPSSDPHAVAIGADGKVYVAASGSYAVYDPLGQTTGAIGTGHSYQSVVASADGKMYFLESGNGKVDALP
jgi:hypothetical protein